MIKSLSVSDIGPFSWQHPLEIELAHPVVAITGPNGSGKSTVLASMLFALSGDHSLLGGSACAHVGSLPDPEPVVVLEFYPTESDDVATIVRSAPTLGKSRRSIRTLTYQGKETRGDAEVSEQLEKWYGLPPKVFTDFSFVPQDALTAVVNADAGTRKKAIARLLGLDRAEQVWSALAADVVVPDDGVSADIEAVMVANAAAAGDRVKAAGEELSKLLAPTAAQVQAACDLEVQAVVAVEMWDRVGGAKDRAADYATKVNELGAVLDGLRVDVAAAVFQSQEADSNVQTAAALATHRQVTQEIATLTEQCEQLRQAAVVIGDRPVLAPDVVAVLAPSSIVRRVAAVPVAGDCPTCLRPVSPDFSTTVADAVNTLAAAKAVEARHNLTVQTYDATDVCYQRSAERLAALEARLDQLKVMRANLLPAAPLSGSVCDIRILRQIRDAAAGRVDEFQRRLKSTADELQAVSAKLIAEVSMFDKAVPPTIDPQVAATNAAELRDQFDKRARAVSRLEDLKQAYIGELAALDQFRKTSATVADRKAYADRAAAVRAVYHRDAAPAAIINKHLRDFVPALNGWLGTFGADFRVDYDDSGYTVMFATGRPLPISRLSGGQKAVFAWAWVSARQAAFGDRLWLLALDEPTYGLDAERRSALINAIEGWRHHHPGRQLVIVTHDTALAAACDCVIEIG